MITWTRCLIAQGYFIYVQCQPTQASPSSTHHVLFSSANLSLVDREFVVAERPPFYWRTLYHELAIIPSASFSRIRVLSSPALFGATSETNLKTPFGFRSNEFWLSSTLVVLAQSQEPFAFTSFVHRNHERHVDVGAHVNDDDIGNAGASSSGISLQSHWAPKLFANCFGNAWHVDGHGYEHDHEHEHEQSIQLYGLQNVCKSPDRTPTQPLPPDTRDTTNKLTFFASYLQMMLLNWDTTGSCKFESTTKDTPNQTVSFTNA